MDFLFVRYSITPFFTSQIESYYVGKLLDKEKEPVEPDHVFIFVKFVDIENKMYLEMQRWAIEQAMAH